MSRLPNYGGLKLGLSVFSCTAGRHDSSRTEIFRPGDSLEGRVILSSGSSFRSRRAEIRLQGWYSNLVSTKLPFLTLLGVQLVSVQTTPETSHRVQLRAGSTVSSMCSLAAVV